MASVLVLFESKYGQSEKIARRIATIAREAGHSTSAVHVSCAADAIAKHELLFLVAPVFAGRHAKAMTVFVRRHIGALHAKKTVFVSVSGAAGEKADAKQAEARQRLAEFLRETDLRPFLGITAGGAIAYPRYGFVVRTFMKWMAKRTGGPTDTSKIHELTDWPALDHDVRMALRAIAPKPGSFTSAAAPA